MAPVDVAQRASNACEGGSSIPSPEEVRNVTFIDNGV